MERRIFVRSVLKILALGGAFFLAGCGKEKTTLGFGNQERLWQMATGQKPLEEPVDLAYAKDTPAFYRDASFGKADPSFVPKISGG